MIEDLRRKALVCTECPLHKGRKNVVFGEGPIDAKILIVGEGPGSEEDKSGRPFVGMAGRILTRLLEKNGISRKDVYITNIVLCRPPGNRKPLKKEIQTCTSLYLNNRIAWINPKGILLLGNTAMETVLGKTCMTKNRGLVFHIRGRIIMPTYHPAALLYNPDLTSEFEKELQNFIGKIKL